MKKKYILLTGYFNNNLGDDLFIKILLDRYPGTDFLAISSIDNFKAFKNHKNISRITRSQHNIFDEIVGFFIKGYLENISLDRLYDLLSPIKNNIYGVVHIGGSMFIENTNSYLPHSAFYRKLDNALRCSNIFFIGCNFGPFENVAFKLDYDDYFPRVCDICFREKYSLELFPDLKNARLAPDVVFSLNTPKSISKVKGSVGFSIIDATSRKELAPFATNYFKVMANLITSYLKAGRKVMLFSFCEAEGDLAAISKVGRYLSSADFEKVEVIPYEGDIDCFLRLFQRVETMYCTRFHALILGFIFKQNVVPISYSNKITNVLADIGFSNKSYRIDQLSHINTNYIAKQKLTNIEELKIGSIHQFDALDKFINKALRRCV